MNKNKSLSSVAPDAGWRRCTAAARASGRQVFASCRRRWLISFVSRRFRPGQRRGAFLVVAPLSCVIGAHSIGFATNSQRNFCRQQLRYKFRAGDVQMLVPGAQIGAQIGAPVLAATGISRPRHRASRRCQVIRLAAVGADAFAPALVCADNIDAVGCHRAARVANRASPARASLPAPLDSCNARWCIGRREWPPAE